MEYMRFSGTKLLTVHCKGACPTVLVEHRFLQGMRKTPAYTVVVLAMREPNGLLSKHETPMCTTCRDRLWKDGPQPGELEAIYQQDCEQWGVNARRTGMGEAEKRARLAPLMLRTPLRVLRETASSA